MTETTEMTHSQTKGKIIASAEKALDNTDEEILTSPDAIECVQTVLDTVYAASECKLWEVPSVGMAVNPMGETFPYGTFISFIPDAGDKVEGHFAGTFAFTRSLSENRIDAVLRVSGHAEESGHHLVDQGSCRANEMSEAQVLTGVAMFGIAFSSRLPE